MPASARFTTFLPFILIHETVFRKGHYGDYAFAIVENEPGDSGGKTKYGVDKAAHPHVDIDHLTLEGATEIYQDEWDASNAEQYPYPLGEAYFDEAINAGKSRAVKILAASKGDVRRYNSARLDFYARLAAHKPVLKRFLNGWNNRVYDLNKYLKLTVR